MTEQEFIARRNSALLKLETAANIWDQFTKNAADQLVTTPNGTIVPLAGLVETLTQLPASINSLLDETIDTLNKLPISPPNEGN
jgi:hypothetical protein